MSFSKVLSIHNQSSFCFSVHLKTDEKITLTAGRDGGLQNMEIRGLMVLRISDSEMAKIKLSVENDDNRGFQMQVHCMIVVDFSVH